EITEIPSTTTVEVIIDKVAEMVKSGKIREIADMRDETDLNGLKLTIDLNRGVDPDKLMQKLFRATSLEDNFGCNFIILVGGVPQVMGIGPILEEWTAFRRECVRRRVAHELDRKSSKLHLLKGLAKILLDIDKAVRIVRETEEEREVVPNLMIGFGIDEKQAEFVAEIKLRHLNREHILKRTAEIESLEKEVADLKDILADRKRVDKIIITELKEVAAKYGKPRRSEILMEFESSAASAEEQEVPDYPVVLFFSREGYFKKITPQSLRMSGEQKLKEGDEIVTRLETQNNIHLLFFSDKGQVYKADAADFEDTKASVMGDYIPAKLGMDEGETAIAMVATMDFKGWVFFTFENGKAAKVELASYETKTKRRKLTGAYSTKSPLVSIHAFTEERDFLMTASSGRMLIVGTAAILAKASRDTQGVQVMTLRKNARVLSCEPFEEVKLSASHRYRSRTLPGSGSLPRPEDLGEQLKL
ncbi:MAG: topoisomerase IV, partial [Oscillospiraceae bacterium]|nr:topoisomerase IV [Oscillospiraceae bacterium]